MPQSLSKVYVHITFSTKYRLPSIDDSIQSDLWNYLGGICKQLECNPVQIGGYNDHVHILCTLSRKISQMYLVEKLKTGSSKRIKTQGAYYSNFYRQNGYGIFSVNPTEIDRVIAYIQGQKEHHTKQAFQSEFLAFLHKYAIAYDEKYVRD
ncbi:MAG: IS200/IS605 family transposase [Candidatus Peribacteria bacterium]|jgi:REP element-mobilizing transposase RayT|nr:IS200/IS605 family transposase [Candidatus Peribacteria bacterium]